MWSPSDPWVGFWLPLALLCLTTGFWLTDRKDTRKRLAGVTLLASMVLIVLFGANTRGGDTSETALLAVHLHMLGPVTLMAVGSLIATFSGPSPVGPLPRGLRPFGFLMAMGGLVWIGLMLISVPPDAIANGIGETIWSTWVDVFLSILILVAALAGSFCIMLGDERHKEAFTLVILTIIGGSMFYEIMHNGSDGLEAAGWHQIHWEQMMFLIGGLIGTALALIAFIGLVYMAERRAPDPDVVSPLTEEEKSVVDAVLRLNLELEGVEE
jgi:hypothetical protein